LHERKGRNVQGRVTRCIPEKVRKQKSRRLKSAYK